MHAPVALAHDEARLLEHAQVPRDGGRGHAEGFGELAHARRSRRQPLEHLAAERVGERREDGVERIGSTINHVVNYTHGARRAARGISRAPPPTESVGVNALSRAHCRP